MLGMAQLSLQLRPGCPQGLLDRILPVPWGFLHHSQIGDLGPRRSKQQEGDGRDEGEDEGNRPRFSLARRCRKGPRRTATPFPLEDSQGGCQAPPQHEVTNTQKAYKGLHRVTSSSGKHEMQMSTKQQPPAPTLQVPPRVKQPE